MALTLLPDYLVKPYKLDASLCLLLPTFRWVELSGSRGSLLILSPLRTVRAFFKAHRSSISKALLDRETRMSVTAHTSRYTRRAVGHCGNGVGAPANDTTALCTVAAISFPTLNGLPPFLVTRHPLEVCPLSRGANGNPTDCSNPYPAHYEPAFAFSSILYPHPYQLTSRFTFLITRRDMGLPRFT